MSLFGQHGAYVHGLSLVTEGVSSMEEIENLSAAPSGDGARMDMLPGAGARDRCHLCLSGQAICRKIVFFTGI